MLGDKGFDSDEIRGACLEGARRPAGDPQQVKPQGAVALGR